MSFAWIFGRNTQNEKNEEIKSFFSLARIFNLFMMNNRRYLFVWIVSAILYVCLRVFVWCAHELNETTTAKQRKRVHEITTQTMEKRRFIENSTKQSITAKWVKWKQSSGWNLLFFFLRFLTCRRGNSSEIFVLSHRHRGWRGEKLVLIAKISVY